MSNYPRAKTIFNLWTNARYGSYVTNDVRPHPGTNYSLRKHSPILTHPPCVLKLRVYTPQLWITRIHLQISCAKPSMVGSMFIAYTHIPYGALRQATRPQLQPSLPCWLMGMARPASVVTRDLIIIMFGGGGGVNMPTGYCVVLCVSLVSCVICSKCMLCCLCLCC